MTLASPQVTSRTAIYVAMSDAY